MPDVCNRWAWHEDTARSILAALPPDWCGHEVEIADAQRWRDAEAEGHIVNFTVDGYGLQHPPSCRPNLTGCAYHLWLADDDEPAMSPGRYRMTLVSPDGYDEAKYAALAQPEEGAAIARVNRYVEDSLLTRGLERAVDAALTQPGGDR